MSWCDKLASTPGVGLRLDKSYLPVDRLLEPLAPMMSKWVDKEKPTFNIEGQDAFGFSMGTFEGFHYLANPEQLAVEFKHRLRLQPRSAGPPTAEMISKPLPYTQLLPKVSDRLIEFSRLITSGTTRKLNRLGIISTTVVSLEDAPPGIVRLLEHFGRPWSEHLEFYNIQITAELPKSKGTLDHDRCIHQVLRAEDDIDGLVTIRLDWQRYLDEGRTLSMTSLPKLLEGAATDAFAYFEDVAEGARFDGSIQEQSDTKTKPAN